MYHMFLNDECSEALRLYVVKRPDVPSPQKRYNEKGLPGRDGKLYEDTGYYEDITISVELNYMTSPDNWNNVWRMAKRWLLTSVGKRLSFSDDRSVYYRIKKVEVSTNARNSLRIGRFTVSLTLDPYTYLLSGIQLYDPQQIKDNPYEETTPVYFIKGEGVCTLTVNGHAIKANVGQNLTIDTYRRIAYRSDGTLHNTAISGNYEDMLLIEGENKISISEPAKFTLTIQPNWRCI